MLSLANTTWTSNHGLHSKVWLNPIKWLWHAQKGRAMTYVCINSDTLAIPQLMQETWHKNQVYKSNCIPITVIAFALFMWSSERLSIDNQFILHEHCCSLTVVSCDLLPTIAAVCTQSKRALWCNSHFIHCTKTEVGDSVWGCTRDRHWASGVRVGFTSPVLDRVAGDHLTNS